MINFSFIFNPDRIPLELQQWKMNHINPDAGSYGLFTDSLPQADQFFENEHYQLYIIGNVVMHKNTKQHFNNLIATGLVSSQQAINCFQQISGISCILRIDKLKKRHILWTDPLGFYPLYVFEKNNLFILSTQQKLFNTIPELHLTIDNQAIQSYLLNGHMISDRSWFKEIKRCKPATTYVFNTQEQTITSSYYWTWSQVQEKMKSGAEIKSDYYLKFRNGILNLDLDNKHSLGISLSGGLDSRWIADIAKDQYKIEAFSFGDQESIELNIAKKASGVLGLKHRIISIDPKNFLNKRMESFWKLDGMLHLGHLHEAGLHSDLHSRYPAVFHGFFGGGVYASPRECNTRINAEMASKHFNFLDDIELWNDPYFDIPRIDPYIIHQRIRNQSAFSPVLLSYYSKMILPFYNLEWLELNYGIDDRQQCWSKFYLEVLSQFMTAKLNNIPWQRTLMPPKWINTNVLAQRLRFPELSEMLFQTTGSSRHFINYRYFDKELRQWLIHFNKEVAQWSEILKPISRENSFRLLSLVVWLKMLSKNSPHVL